MIYTDKYIFVHVPKTGGQSISNALGNHKKREQSTHTPLRCVEKGDRFAFGFIRNPWARMVSLYRFCCQKNMGRGDNFDQKEIRDMGFKKWLLEYPFYMKEDIKPLDNVGNRVIRENWRSFDTPSKEFQKVEDRVERMQERPQMFWLDGCDYIGRVEDYPDSFHKALSVGGLEKRVLPHINKTKGGDWRLEYDNEMIDHVSNHFNRDIEQGGYTFG